MPKDTKYLKKTDGIWIFQKRVSDEVAGLLGLRSNIYNKSLQTDSLKQAQAERHQYLAYLKKLEDAEAVNPSYQEVMEAYKHMEPDRISHEYELLNDELSMTYSHLGHPEWEGMTEQEKIASGLPTGVNESDDIKYRVLASLSGRSPNFQPPEKYRLRLTTALEKHLEELTDLTPKALGKYRNSIKNFIAYLGVEDILVFRIDRLTVRNFITHCQKEVDGKQIYADATIVNMLSNLGSVWDYVRDAENLNEANPFREHRITKKVSVKKRGRQKSKDNWDPDDLRKVIAELKQGEHGDLDALPVYIAWYTGSRLNEAYGLKPEFISTDDETGIPYISFKEKFDGKTESITRICPIHPELEKLLEGFAGFPRPTHGAYGSHFGRVKSKLGFKKGREVFHSIRGNTSTALEMMQCPPHFASQIVGHAKDSTFTYDYYSEGAGLKVLYDYVKQIPKL